MKVYSESAIVESARENQREQLGDEDSPNVDVEIENWDDDLFELFDFISSE